MPGCYDGRWPHIHFEVYRNLESATDHKNAVLTSQFAMPAGACAAVYNSAKGYEASIASFGRISIASDMVFGDDSENEIAMMTPALTGSPGDGYIADVVVGEHPVELSRVHHHPSVVVGLRPGRSRGRAGSARRRRPS